MFRCGIRYQTNLLHIDYNNQHFEPIEYTCDVSVKLIQVKKILNDINYKLNDYSILSKPMKQEMQTFAKNLHFH